MLKTVIVLPDGSELSSGTGTQNAIQSVSITQCVNDSRELTLGSVCAGILEATLITPAGGLALTAGHEVQVYRVGEDGSCAKLGVFILEKPTRPTANTMKLTAYDRITKLDRDLTGWLAELTGWPYSLYQLAKMVCGQCDLELVNESIPNGDHPVQKFSADGITGRQLMKWIGEAAGRFCRATPDGDIEFAWYTPATVQIAPNAGSGVAFAGGQLSLRVDSGSVSGTDGNVILTSQNITVSHDAAGNVTLTVGGEMDKLYYLQDALRFEDYAVMPIEKVQIRQTQEDVGVIHPDAVGQRNTYIISGNGLLSASDGEALKAIAQTLYAQLQAVTYTPCKVTIPVCPEIGAGNTVSITDINGKTVTCYVMTKKSSGQCDTIECTGSNRRDSTTVVNTQSYKALSGKTLELQKTVDGLSIQATALREQADGNTEAISRLDQKADSIGVQVSSRQVGGTNLLRNTNQGITNWWYSTYDGESTMEEYTEGDDVRGMKITCLRASTGWQNIQFVSKSTLAKLIPNAEYVVSFDLKTNISGRLSMCIVSGDSSKALTVWDHVQMEGDENWHKIIARLTTNDLSAGLHNQTLYIVGINTPGYYIIRNLKLEKGNMATDWCPAPEDVRDDIDAAKNAVLEKTAELHIRADSIQASVKETGGTVDALDKRMTKAEQTAKQITLQVQSIEENGISKVQTETGYTFDKNGLRITKSGQPMENLLDNTGMYVKRSGDVLLQANDKGVQAVDVTVKNYLIMGDHARFEDYNGGTGCFWI